MTLLAESITACALRISEEVASAADQGTPLRIAGSGNWLHAGAPVTADKTISLHGDGGVVDYVPGDLTMTVLAGTTLSQIDALAATENQWLTLDPYGSAAGSIGATVATGSYGPLAHAYGTPRDHLLGVEAVTGTGDVIRAGGRVTKNVAGFDITRLMCGAWGTLGVITEVSLRLRARPERDVTVALQLPTDAAKLHELLRQIRSLHIEPAALQLYSGRAEIPTEDGSPMPARPAAAARVDDASRSRKRHSAAVLIRLAGNAAGVAEQLARLQRVGSPAVIDGMFWTMMRGSDDARHATFRISDAATSLPALWEKVMRACGGVDDLSMTATVERGLVRCTLPSADAAHVLGRLELQNHPGSLVCECLPPDAWSLLHDRPRRNATLAARVRDAFDPQRILNRGILGEPST